jgi:hypothetical protein
MITHSLVCHFSPVCTANTIPPTTLLLVSTTSLAKDVDNGETEIKILGHDDATCSKAGRVSSRLSLPGLDDVGTSDGRTDSEQIEHEESLTIQQADKGRADKWGAEEDQGNGGDEDDSDMPAQHVRSQVVSSSLLH